MPSSPELNERERRVLEAVIQCYVETAEPAGSRTLSRHFALGVSAATIRNTMSDLEEKGFLFHPHTSAGRIPTDKAYRLYVDALMHVGPAAGVEHERLREELVAGASGLDDVLRRAAQSLGVLTQELGVALGPALDDAVLKRLELVQLSSERLLLVLTLAGGTVRTIFVELRTAIPDGTLAEVVVVLNERLAGLTMREVRSSLASRLRDTAPSVAAGELLNIFLEEGEQLFDMGAGQTPAVVLGQASVLADQPEFSTTESMRKLLALTDTRIHLADVLRHRAGGPGVSISIGNEHADPRLEPFTVVTAGYRAGELQGVIGVIGPTRMPYDKVVALVGHASQLISDLLA